MTSITLGTAMGLGALGRHAGHKLFIFADMYLRPVRTFAMDGKAGYEKLARIPAGVLPQNDRCEPRDDDREAEVW